jgi:hypothetical protein
MKCKKCELKKDVSEFYANDRTCKECRKKAVRANRLSKADYYREYDRKRANNPDRVAARKAYSKTEAGKEAHKRATKKWIEKNPIKRAAHILVGNAIRDGKLLKSTCEICGSKDVHAHHDDYARPLEVRWLCDEHHNEWHRINGEGKNAT